MLASGINSEVTYVSINASSKFIFLTHILQLTNLTKNSIDNPFESILVFSLLHLNVLILAVLMM